MQALDNFISPSLGFEGDILIPTILVSAQSPGGEADSDPSTRASGCMPRTRASKQSPLEARPLKRKPRKLQESL
jgi:hypothetical protein